MILISNHLLTLPEFEKVEDVVIRINMAHVKDMKQLKTEILHQQLNGWDGYSRRGQAIYDAIFEQEKAQAAEEDCKEGICSCCEDSMYYGI